MNKDQRREASGHDPKTTATPPTDQKAEKAEAAQVVKELEGVAVEDFKPEGIKDAPHHGIRIADAREISMNRVVDGIQSFKFLMYA